MSQISLLQLPLDVLVKIMGKLSYSDLRNVMLTCKTLMELVLNENSIWRLASRSKTLIHNATDNSQTNQFSSFHRCRISNNWIKGIYRSKIILYHQINFMPWLTLHNSQALLLAVGSDLQCFPTDKKGIPYCKDLLWKVKVPTVKRYDVRTNDISRFVVRDGLIVCGNRDGCVAVYKMDNIRQRPHLLHHIRDCHENGQVEVSAVEIIASHDKMYVVTASENTPKLCFWSLISDLSPTDNWAPHEDNIDCASEISLGENTGIRCLHVHNTGDKLAIGLNGNSRPLMLEITTGKLLLNCEATKNYKQTIRDIRWHDSNTIMYVTHSGILQLLDVRSSEVVFDLMDPFQSTLYCVKSDGHNAIVVGSSEYSRCVLFDARNTSQHVQMYFTQKKSSPIYSLDFDATKLIAAADRSVAVLNFNVRSKSVESRDYSHTFELVNR